MKNMKHYEEMITGYLVEKEEILFAYIHGSFLLRKDYKDIDVALYLNEDKAGIIDHIDYGINCSVELEKKTGKTIDVRVLNNASLSFKYHASGGKLLFSRNEIVREDFLCRAWSEYFDFQPVALRYLKEVLHG